MFYNHVGNEVVEDQINTSGVCQLVKADLNAKIHISDSKEMV